MKDSFTPLSIEQIVKMLDQERAKWSSRTGPPTYDFAISLTRTLEAAIHKQESTENDRTTTL